MQVLDASVIYKWYQQEAYSDKALKIRDEYLAYGHKISVPDLLLLELANIVRFKKGAHPDDIKKVINNVVKLGIDIVTPTLGLIEKAGELSFRYDITIYDALYLALSTEMDYVFITADNVFYEKISSIQNVKLLRDI